MYILFLDEIDGDASHQVGSKGSNLGKLYKAGFPVPGGFCVTTQVYRRLVDDPGIQKGIKALSAADSTDTQALFDAARRLREQISLREVPQDIQQAIREALHRNGAEKAYAVRSSATAEDLPEASFAGQHETVLHVRGADRLVDAVKTCMASLFTDRAVVYRARNGIDHSAVAMAVVVQEMVSADISGVLFTADTESGNRGVASIDAVHGFGDALVSGAVNPDHILAAKADNEIITYTTPEDGGKRVLTNDQVTEVVRTGEQIERLFDAPQDIEWSISQDRLYILQARPITTLFPLPAPFPIDGKLHVYLSMGHAQGMSEALPPLAVDALISLIENGMSARGFSNVKSLGVEAGGRAYLDFTGLLHVEMLRHLTMGWLVQVSTPASQGLLDLLERREPAFRDKGTRTPLSSLRAVLRYLILTSPAMPYVAWKFLVTLFGPASNRQEEESFYEAWGRREATRIARESNSPAQKVRAAFQLFEVQDAMRIIYPRIVPLFTAIAALGRLRRLLPDQAQEVDAIARGFPDDLVTRINLLLGDIADTARKNPEVAEALGAGKSLQEIAMIEGSGPFMAQFEEFLEEFGFRAAGELNLARPRWSEDPAPLLGIIRANLQAPEPGMHQARMRQLVEEAEKAARVLEGKADHGLFGFIRKRCARRLIAVHRGHIWLRDYPKHGVARAFAAQREAILSVADMLVSEGKLAHREDVWFIRKDELLDALEKNKPLDLDIEARKIQHERQKELNAPALFTSEGEIPVGKREQSDVPEGALVGTPVSSGVIEGLARVVFDPTESTVEPGEILVSPSSDPGWTALFLNAAGFVTEVGGYITHGAIVAREYGIPAVVSVTNATRTIKTGQRIRVDGTRGIVEILE